jgi:hypothetical protein
MHNDPIYLLDPVFHFLDGMIRDYGDYLYVLLVYVSIPLSAWILSGGLRRRQTRPHPAVTIPVIVIRPTVQPPPLPPIIGGDRERGEWPSDDDDKSQSFAA